MPSGLFPGGSALVDLVLGVAPGTVLRLFRQHLSTITLCVTRMPIARAAPCERSSDTPLVKGPRSLTRTVTLRPVFGLLTRKQVPNGSDRWAAVKPLGLNLSPDAVRLPASSCPYQVAMTVWPAYAGEQKRMIIKAVFARIARSNS